MSKPLYSGIQKSTIIWGLYRVMDSNHRPVAYKAF